MRGARNARTSNQMTATITAMNSRIPKNIQNNIQIIPPIIIILCPPSLCKTLWCVPLLLEEVLQS
jgi:hypothetical protein